MVSRYGGRQKQQWKIFNQEGSTVTQYVEGEDYYRFTGETKVVDGITVQRIVATQDLPKFKVKAGAVGGYIQARHNLAGGSWVKGNAVVMENATLDQGAFAGGYARIKGNSTVFGNVAIIHSAEVSGDSVITTEVEPVEVAIVIADTSAVRDATISTVKGGHVGITGSALVSDGATIIGGDVVVTGKSVVKEDSLVKGFMDIIDNACVCGGAQVINDGGAPILIIEGDEHISDPFYRRG